MYDSQAPVVIIFGATGAGKSSLLTACGADSFAVGHKLRSKTQNVETWSGYYKGREVTLVDTPGFGDTQMLDSEVLERVCIWLQDHHEAGGKINGIIFLHRITDNRMTNLGKRSIEMVYEICGDEAMKNTVLCTSFWDKIDPEKGAKREKELEAKYCRSMVRQGAVIKRHNNTAESAESILDELVDKPAITLQLQEEITEGAKLNETSVGIALLGDLGVMEPEMIRRMKELHVEFTKENDEKLKAMLEEEQKRNIEQYRRLHEDRLRMEQDILTIKENKKNPENESVWFNLAKIAVNVVLVGLGLLPIFLGL